LLLYGDALLVKIGLTTIDECKGIRLPVKFGEVELVEPGRPITQMVALARTLGA
jgi:hypothetical protein